ncbi:BMP family ABC transporter substrate-binding protein [Amycolatopsis alba]|uniref:BMP family ABC transporter substrate-binding protein n=1 Tax=Amycolatopsis alba TaxID=76020 RepID=UPI000379CB39|nr:BMP family ABC transporter substrate-binding protein [Amycolatopsis alba]
MKGTKLRGVVAVLAAVVAVQLTACSAGGGQPHPVGATPKVALVLGGSATDRGFNQVAADAASELQKRGAISFQVSENVTNAEAESKMRQYATSGYDLVVGWGLGFSDTVFKVATQIPTARFVATGGVDILNKATPSVETWTYAAEQLGYLMGIIAGSTQLSPVGIVDGEQAPFVQAQWFGFSQGLAATNPAARQLPPVYTGSWEDAARASQATAAQIAAGARLVATNAEGYSPGVASAAQAGGIATVGLATLTSAAAASVNVGQVKTDLTPILTEWITRLKNGTFGSRGTTSTIANRSLVPADLTSVAAAPGMPSDLDKRIADLAERLRAGTVTITPWQPGR